MKTSAARPLSLVKPPEPKIDHDALTQILEDMRATRACITRFAAGNRLDDVLLFLAGILVGVILTITIFSLLGTI